MKNFHHKNNKKDSIKQAIVDRNKKLINIYLSGLTYKQTGKKFKVSRQRVRQILDKNCIKLHPTIKEIIIENLSKIKEEVSKGKTLKEISCMIGIKTEALMAYIYLLKLNLKIIRQEFNKTVKCSICGENAFCIKHKLCKKHYARLQYEKSWKTGYYQKYWCKYQEEHREYIREYYRKYRNKKRLLGTNQ